MVKVVVCGANPKLFLSGRFVFVKLVVSNVSNERMQLERWRLIIQGREIEEIVTR